MTSHKWVRDIKGQSLDIWGGEGGRKLFWWKYIYYVPRDQGYLFCALVCKDLFFSFVFHMDWQNHGLGFFFPLLKTGFFFSEIQAKKTPSPPLNIL